MLFIKIKQKSEILFRLEVRTTKRSSFHQNTTQNFSLTKEDKGTRKKRFIYHTYIPSSRSLSLCVSLEITHPYSRRVFFIPSFVLSSFSDDDDVFWIIRPFFKAMMMVFILFSFQKIIFQRGQIRRQNSTIYIRRFERCRDDRFVRSRFLIGFGN